MRFWYETHGLYPAKNNISVLNELVYHNVNNQTENYKHC